MIPCISTVTFTEHLQRFFFFNFLLFSGNKTGISLLSHGIKKKKEEGGYLRHWLVHLQGNVLTSLFSAAEKALYGEHILTSLPRNCHCDYSKIMDLALTQKYKVIFFLKLGIIKVKVSLVTRNERKLPVTKINILTANVYIHYWWVLHLTVSVLDAIYRSFPGFNILSNWSAYKTYTKVDLFWYGNCYILETKLNGIYSPHLEISKSFNPKYQT